MRTCGSYWQDTIVRESCVQVIEMHLGMEVDKSMRQVENNTLGNADKLSRMNNLLYFSDHLGNYSLYFPFKFTRK
jgi:hypothetical protein